MHLIACFPLLQSASSLQASLSAQEKALADERSSASAAQASLRGQLAEAQAGARAAADGSNARIAQMEAEREQ